MTPFDRLTKVGQLFRIGRLVLNVNMALTNVAEMLEHRSRLVPPSTPSHEKHEWVTPLMAACTLHPREQVYIFDLARKMRPKNSLITHSDMDVHHLEMCLPGNGMSCWVNAANLWKKEER